MKDIIIGMLLGAFVVGLATFYGYSTSASQCPCHNSFIKSDVRDCGSH